MNQRSAILVIVVALVAVAVYLVWDSARGPSGVAPTATPTPQTGQTTPPAQTSVQAAPTPTSAPTATPTVAATPADDLSTVLLTLADMPSNVWTERAEETPTDGDSITFLCQNITRRSGEVARTAFQRTPYGPIVRSSIATYAAGDAEAFMADVQAAVDGCTAWQTTETNGQQTNWRATPVDIAGLGDQVIAVQARTVGEVSFSQVTNGFAYIRVGNRIASISTTTVNPFGGLADDHLEQFSRVVAERLQALAPQ